MNFRPFLGNRVGRGVDVIAANRDVLNALAFIFLEVADDLPGFARDPR